MSAEYFSHAPAETTSNALFVEVRDGKVIFKVSSQGGRYAGEPMNVTMIAEVPALEVFNLADMLEAAYGNALYEEVARGTSQR